MTTLGIIGAMDEEIQLLLQGLEATETFSYAGTFFSKGIFYGKEIVVCKSGVGKVNAAMTAQLLIDRFEIGAVWFTGVAGAVDPSLEIGDIVISSSCQQHDMDCSPLGYPVGVTPYQEVSDFPAHPPFIALAQQACERVCTSTSSSYLTGRVLSGDQFIADSALIKQFYEEMGGACVEMEGAAVAQVCCRNELPYVMLRSMSDKADGTASANYAEFSTEAANRSYEIIADMLANYEG